MILFQVERIKAMNRSKDNNDILCRLLGIEPKEYQRPDDEIYWGSKSETMRDIDVIYPDLTSPSNFVRLLGINFKSRWGKSTGFADCFDNACKFYYEKNMYWANKAGLTVDNNDFMDCFLSSIIIELMIFKSEDFDIDSPNRLIIKQARSTQWDY